VRLRIVLTTMLNSFNTNTYFSKIDEIVTKDKILL